MALPCRLRRLTRPDNGGYIYVRVVDPVSGIEKPPGGIGLLLVRGYTTTHYYENAFETAEAFTDDGYYKTGDLGSFGEDGYFRYHSRLKEMVKVGGINVSPVEVEQILLCHPQIREAAVVGVSDPLQGEALAAVIVITGDLTTQDVHSYMRDTAASFKTPSHIIVQSADWIPRTASGKVSKQVLKEKVLSHLT